MEISTLMIITFTATLVTAKLGVMAFCVAQIAESFKQPVAEAFRKRFRRLSPSA